MPSERDSTENSVSQKLHTTTIAPYMYVLLLAFSVVSIALMGVIVHKLANTSMHVKTVRTDVTGMKYGAEHLRRMAKTLEGFADGSQSVARLFRGSLAAKVTDMMCPDFSGVAAKVSSLAGKIKDTLLANGGGSGGTDVEFADGAKISAMVESIATIAQNLDKPASCPSTRSVVSADGQLTGSGGFLLEPMTYILDFVENQTDAASWKQAATQCKDLLHSMKQLSWTGSVDCWHCPEGRYESPGQDYVIYAIDGKSSVVRKCMKLDYGLHEEGGCEMLFGPNLTADRLSTEAPAAPPTMPATPCTNYPVSMNLGGYPSEVKWAISTAVELGGNTICSGGTYGSQNAHSNINAGSCCLIDGGSYVLTCEDTYGDGWNGGSLSVNGTTYCEGFSYGKFQTGALGRPITNSPTRGDDPNDCDMTSIYIYKDGNGNPYGVPWGHVWNGVVPADKCGQPACTCCQFEPLVSSKCDWSANGAIKDSDKPVQRIAAWCEAISQISV